MRTAREVAAEKEIEREFIFGELESKGFERLFHVVTSDRRYLRQSKRGKRISIDNNYRTTTRVDRVRQRLQAVDALSLRIQGYSLETIRDKCGYSSVREASDAISKLLVAYEIETIEDARKIELARMDRMLEMIVSKIDSGSLSAIDRALKLSERRAKLLGLDAPEQVNQTGEITVSVEVIRSDDWDTNTNTNGARAYDGDDTE